MAVGTECHAILERLDFARPRVPDDASDESREILEAFFGSDTGAALIERLRAAVGFTGALHLFADHTLLAIEGEVLMLRLRHETALAELEGADASVAFATGMAAISAAIMPPIAPAP